MRGFKSLLLVSVVGLVIECWPGRSLAAGIDSAAAWVPQNAPAALVVKNPASLIEQWEKSPLRQAVANNPGFQAVLNNPGIKQADALVGLVEVHTKKDRWTLLKQALGGGLFVAALPQGEVVVIAEAQDGKVLRDVHEFLLGLAKLDAENKGQPDRVKSADYRGVTAWTFGGDEVHAIVENRLILVNKPELMKQIIDRIQDSHGGSLRDNPKFTAAEKATADHNLVLYLDLETLRALPNVQKGLEQSRQPLPILLLAGTITALQKAPWLAVGLSIEGSRVTGTLQTGEVAQWPEPLAFALAPGKDGALPPIHVPGTVFTASFYRNLRDFYAQKNELFPERTSGLIFFENMMGIFFTGRNFTEEVLAELEPYVRVVVAEQRYSPEIGTPAVQLPAMAVVFRMKNPKKFQPVVEEGFQKALGLINFVRGQDAKPGMILDRPVYKGVKYTLAYFNPDPDGDKEHADIRFNFSPVLACRDRDLILSTAEPLAKDILDALAEQEAAVQNVHKAVTTHLELLGTQIVRLLEVNKEALIAQNMAEKGHSRERAETELSQLLMVLRMLNEFRLTESFHNHSNRWDFQLELIKP
ncbi:hypothetical protein [Thermogutta sp.]|uniref:hypothetical protein n=1 Tax=Thermogutta sp. TaxID=1962930 RepID=UPI003C79C6B4